ncbi:MAG TPA: enoyl-CoA hydratase [Acidimicrobiales bacterium]|nr:enoyl-CoA hydratase [Acidimicrobiales bacterium]
METIEVDRAGGVVEVTLNRPDKRNAANATMWEELLAVFEETALRPEDRVVVIAGAGGAFCSGADLTDPRAQEEQPLARMRRINKTALALHRLAKPTIAKVGGVAAGAGCNLALGCDLVVASEDARFSEIFARRGLSVDFGGSWLLPRLIGVHKAKELAFFADILSAPEAERLGIVNRVVAADELDEFVAGWAARLAAGPPVALSMTKTLINDGLDVSLEQALESEARCQSVNFATADTAEAMRAFVERRDPVFEGR